MIRELHVAAHDDDSPAAFSAVLRLRRTIDALLARLLEGLLATLRAPPMWKVRIVSCVPGSPMDCAAMMPTASPVLTMVPRARSRP
jgi:hypothetical protein